ncbi:MAG TPA: Uma2 family endonuclease [Polyangiaceae bacterium]|nr:Uma2 family endonuclease [Polyangiaceae bacterium]
MLARRLADHDDTPVDDQIVVLRGATWGDYQRVLEMRGEVSSPRVAYLEGALEIMTPSRAHEGLKFKIGRLLEVWCLENAIEFSGYGSWTLEGGERDRGVEPDECYVFGDVREPTRPDLAIEVVWTSGGIDKLEIYRKLGVREVWFWRRGQLTADLLRGDAFVEASESAVLSGIDLGELASFLDRPTASLAIREYRAALLARRA